MEEKVITSSEGNVYYWISNTGKDRTILFIHGLTADHTLFDNQIGFFCENYNVITIDLPKHGRSRPYGVFTYSNCADIIKKIIMNEGFERIIIAGQSMGGYVAQMVLIKYPDLVTHFISIDSTPFGHRYYSGFDRYILKRIEPLAKLYSRKALIESIAKSNTRTPGSYASMKKTLEQYEKNEVCELMGIAYKTFLDENCDAEFDIPMLLLLGEYDKTGKVRKYCMQWQRATGARLVIIPDAAHNSNYDNYEYVNNVILGFLEGEKTV